MLKFGVWMIETTTRVHKFPRNQNNFTEIIMATESPAADFYDEKDFDAILACLEEEEDYQMEFNIAINDIEEYQHICEVCAKVCKSKGGLKRHSIVHLRDCDRVVNKEENSLTQELLLNLLEEVRQNAMINKCYPENIKTILTEYNSININNDTYEIISQIYQKYYANGNTETFYATMLSDVILNASKHLLEIHIDAATLLLKKLTDRLISLRKESKEKKDVKIISPLDQILKDVQKLTLTEIEMHGLRYIGGYVYKNIYKKIKNSKNWKTTRNQMILSFLDSGREQDNIDECVTFMDKIDRGGLWRLSPPAEDLFLNVEKIFRNSTDESVGRNIDLKGIVLEAYTNYETIQCCQTLLIGSIMEVDVSTAKDVIFSLINLYIKVRSYSKARKLIEQYKAKSNTKSKEKSLRKDLEQKSDTK